MAASLYKKGHVGIISRSGTLTHEVASNMSFRGVGQSTCVCIGGDAAKGADFVDILELFREDPQTRQIVMIGEIGGAGEESAARYIAQSRYPKPVAAFIAGINAPAEKRMGHAGAIIADGFGTAESKTSALSAAGVNVAKKLEDIYAWAETARER
jgi:succinyl-CoA synthetase alpha subunit